MTDKKELLSSVVLAARVISPELRDLLPRVR